MRNCICFCRVEDGDFDGVDSPKRLYNRKPSIHFYENKVKANTNTNNSNVDDNNKSSNKVFKNSMNLEISLPSILAMT